MKKELRENLILRSQIIKLIRKFFDDQGFIEVETPTIVKLPGMEPYLDPFGTDVISIDDKKHKAYLITSPEYAMKKLLVGGMSKIYQICKSFRNKEPWDDSHNPEFTMIEWYRTGVDYEVIIDDVIGLVQFICKELVKVEKSKSRKVKKVEKGCEHFEVLTVKQAMKKYAQVDLDSCLDMESISALAGDKGYELSVDDVWDDVFYKIFLNEVEPHLGKDRLTVLKDYPAQLAALSKRKKDDRRYAERFEAYLGGLELCNGFSELTDPEEQLERLKQEQDLRKKLGKEYYEIDMSFINALKKGMPKSGGVALGVDRLVMYFAGAESIKDVIAFSMEDVL